MRGVYFIEGAGLIKIGVSIDVVRRFTEIQYMSPTPLTLLGVIEGATDATETWLHRRFQSRRAHGEWFYKDDELREVATGTKVITELLRPTEAAALLGVDHKFITGGAFRDLIVREGPQRGQRLLRHDVEEIAAAVDRELIRKATQAAIRDAMKRLARIASESATDAQRGETRPVLVGVAA